MSTCVCAREGSVPARYVPWPKIRRRVRAFPFFYPPGLTAAEPREPFPRAPPLAGAASVRFPAARPASCCVSIGRTGRPPPTARSDCRKRLCRGGVAPRAGGRVAEGTGRVRGRRAHAAAPAAVDGGAGRLRAAAAGLGAGGGRRAALRRGGDARAPCRPPGGRPRLGPARRRSRASTVRPSRQPHAGTAPWPGGRGGGGAGGRGRRPSRARRRRVHGGARGVALGGRQ